MTSPNTTSTTTSVWFLVGPYDSTETVRHLPIYSVPFVIGRRQDVNLPLAVKTVSSLHAEITEAGDSLLLRDLGSTNGTYVNGKRIEGQVALRQDDLVLFANIAFRVRRQTVHDNTTTVAESACDRALALVQFDKLMAEHAVTPFFQPIVSMAAQRVFSYEVLGRSRLFGLEMPKAMFHVAEELHLEVELSTMLRWEGVRASRDLVGLPHLFLNTHPRELDSPLLIDSVKRVRESDPDRRLTLEIHEAAVTDPARMKLIRAALSDLSVGLAYDDFGAGQSRLNELLESPPDYLKFDMSLIRDIDSASPQRQSLLATLVRVTRELGIISVAEGVETEPESDVCRQMGFDLGQGFLYGRPAPPCENRHLAQ